MADPTFEELGALSFSSLSLTSSGSTLELASATLNDLASASLEDLAGAVYGGTSSASGETSGSPRFTPVRVTSGQLSSLSVVDGQFIVITDTGDMYVDIQSSRLKLGNTSLLARNQGSANAGKYLTVGSDGNVTLASLPLYSGEVE